MSKKVLHVHTLPVISGSGINTLLTMTGLDKNEFDVEFACAPGGPLAGAAIKAGITFHPIKHFRQPIDPVCDLLALFELVGLIRRNRYDIVHTHNSKAGFIGRLAAKIAGTPVIVHTIHGFAFHDFEKPWRRSLFIFLERMAAGWADSLIVISNPLRDWGLRLKIGKAEQYTAIYSGIDITAFQKSFDIAAVKAEFKISAGDKVVGMTAKLWPGKGHDNALAAAKEVLSKIAGVSFVFVGDGELRSHLEQAAKKLGLEDKVIFTGFRDDIARLTAAFDIAILPSHFEGMGRSILEAMACAKPIIASRVGGIPDLVDDGINGILIPPNDSRALAQNLIKLLNDESMRRKLGAAAKEKVSVRYDVNTMVEQISRVYADLIRQKR